MKRLISLALFASGLIVGLAFWGETGERSTASEDGGRHMLKAVVHINFSDSQRQKAGLKNLTNILMQEQGAELEVVCHGGGIGLLVKDKSDHAEAVAQLIQQGVLFAACENTLRDNTIPKENLLPDVTTVPSGAVEVIRKQHEGFAYFKP